jgi:hypothetical protein
MSAARCRQARVGRWWNEGWRSSAAVKMNNRTCATPSFPFSTVSPHLVSVQPMAVHTAADRVPGGAGIQLPLRLSGLFQAQGPSAMFARLAGAGNPLKGSPLLCVVNCSECSPFCSDRLNNSTTRPAVLPAPVPPSVPLLLHSSVQFALVCAVTSAPRSPTQGWRRRRGESAASRLLKHRPFVSHQRYGTSPRQDDRISTIQRRCILSFSHSLRTSSPLARSRPHPLHFPVVSAALVTAASPRSLRTTKRLGFQHISITPAPSQGRRSRFSVRHFCLSSIRCVAVALFTRLDPRAAHKSSLHTHPVSATSPESKRQPTAPR